MRNHRTLFWTALGIGVFMLGLMEYAAASTAERTNYITFSRAVQLPGVTLGAGRYIFELPSPLTAPSVVQVLSRDRRTAYFMGFTHAVERPRGMRSDAPISLGESQAGAPPRIAAWWPIGENTGRQFVYADAR